MDETFEKFITTKKAAGVTDATVKTYREQYHGFKAYADNYNGKAEDFTNEQLAAAVDAMRGKGVASRTIKSYTGVMKTFFGWCRENEIPAIFTKQYKAEESIKPTYTDNELARLLKNPT